MSCSSVSGIWDTWWWDMISDKFGQPYSCSPYGLSLGLCSLSSTFLSRHPSLLGISYSQGSSLQLWLLFPSLTHHSVRMPIEVLKPLLHWPETPGLPLNSGWKPLWPLSSSILPSCRTSTMGMMPRSATSSGNIWASLDHCCWMKPLSAWVAEYGELNPGENTLFLFF